MTAFLQNLRFMRRTGAAGYMKEGKPAYGSEAGRSPPHTLFRLFKLTAIPATRRRTAP